MPETQPYPHLFSPGQIGTVTIPIGSSNCPMGSGLLVQGQMTEGDITFMEEEGPRGRRTHNHWRGRHPRDRPLAGADQGRSVG